MVNQHTGNISEYPTECSKAMNEESANMCFAFLKIHQNHLPHLFFLAVWSKTDKWETKGAGKQLLK